MRGGSTIGLRVVGFGVRCDHVKATSGCMRKNIRTIGTYICRSVSSFAQYGGTKPCHLGPKKKEHIKEVKDGAEKHVQFQQRDHRGPKPKTFNTQHIRGCFHGSQGSESLFMARAGTGLGLSF